MEDDAQDTHDHAVRNNGHAVRREKSGRGWRDEGGNSLVDPKDLLLSSLWVDVAVQREENRRGREKRGRKE
jgi:hypothetical protein